jgi:hypothetical protein
LFAYLFQIIISSCVCRLPRAIKTLKPPEPTGYGGDQQLGTEALERNKKLSISREQMKGQPSPRSPHVPPCSPSLSPPSPSPPSPSISSPSPAPPTPGLPSSPPEFKKVTYLKSYYHMHGPISPSTHVSSFFFIDRR